jgi:lysozyme
MLAALCLGLAGCTSSADLASSMKPSMETTSSIGRAARPVPPATVKEAIETTTEAVAEAGSMVVDGAADIAEATVQLPAQMAAFVPPARPAFAPDLAARGQVYRHSFRDAKPINFGTRSPRKLAVHGVDVSRWQGDIDWAKLRTQGANFVFIKATDGGDHLDPNFRKNWREADAAGMHRGAYHFFYWCRTAGEQAEWFIRNVPRVAGALPPVIDVEWNGESRCRTRPSPARVREKMQVFMEMLERHYGQRPIIYTAPDFYRDNLQGAFLDYPFWLRSVAAHPADVYPGRKWIFWQYSGSGLSHGVDGRIDLNVFHGSEALWHQWVARSRG